MTLHANKIKQFKGVTRPRMWETCVAAVGGGVGSMQARGHQSSARITRDPWSGDHPGSSVDRSR